MAKVACTRSLSFGSRSFFSAPRPHRPAGHSPAPPCPAVRAPTPARFFRSASYVFRCPPDFFRMPVASTGTPVRHSREPVRQSRWPVRHGQVPRPSEPGGPSVTSPQQSVESSEHAPQRDHQPRCSPLAESCLTKPPSALRQSPRAATRSGEGGFVVWELVGLRFPARARTTTHDDSRGIRKLSTEPDQTHRG